MWYFIGVIFAIVCLMVCGTSVREYRESGGQKLGYVIEAAFGVFIICTLPLWIILAWVISRFPSHDSDEIYERK